MLGIATSDGFTTLYDAHFDLVYRLAFRLGVPAADLDDVAQRVFIVAHRRLREGEQVRQPPAWLRGITVREAAGHRRWRPVRRIAEWLLRTGATPAGPATPDIPVASLEAQQQVAEVLGELGAKLREVLVLSDLEGLGPQEVADTLGIPVDTVRVRRRVARERFEEIWRALHGKGKRRS